MNLIAAILIKFYKKHLLDQTDVVEPINGNVNEQDGTHLTITPTSSHP